MAEVIKHVFKYKEQRRTVFLMAANKDEFGRHRGNVLYGMKISPLNKKIVIGSGALYTPFGTKLFLDVQNPTNTDLMKLDLDDTSVIDIEGLSIFNVSSRTHYPLLVAIIADFKAFHDGEGDLPQSVQIEKETELSAELTFRAKLVSWDRQTINPTFDILAQNPVFMNKGPQSDAETAEYGTRRNWDSDEVVAAPDGQREGALTFNEIVLGYIIIGAPEGSATPPTTLGTGDDWEDGVSCVQGKNAWEAIEDFLGADVLLGRNDRMVTSFPDNSGTAPSALNQVPGVWDIGTQGAGYNTCPLMLSPKFGTTGLDGADFETDWVTYRVPSFLRDGSALIPLMRRLDYVLRLWMNRTGDQALIGQIQDGGASGQQFMSPLEKILAKFDGSNSLTTNLSKLVYSDDGGFAASYNASGTNPNNRVLKTGVTPHLDIQASDINAVLNTNYGDTHFGALRALDQAFHNVLSNILGVTVSRANLRTTVGWSGAATLMTDRPINIATRPPDGNFTVGATTAYMTDTVSIVSAAAELAYRSTRGPSRNILKNGSFYSGDGSSAANWTLSSTTMVRAASATDIWTATLTMANNGTMAQFSTAPTWWIKLLSCAGLASGAITLSNTTALKLNIYGKLSGTDVFRAVLDIPISANVRTVTLSFKIPLGMTIDALRYELQNVSGGACTALVYGAAMVSGIPPASAVDLTHAEFLARDGSSMRGPLDMGTVYKIVNLGAGTSAGDAVNRSQLDLKVAKAGDTMSGALGMGNNQINLLGAPSLSTDAARLADVSSEGATRSAADTAIIAMLPMARRVEIATTVNNSTVLAFTSLFLSPLPPGSWLIEAEMYVSLTQMVSGLRFCAATYINDGHIVSGSFDVDAMEFRSGASGAAVIGLIDSILCISAHNLHRPGDNDTTNVSRFAFTDGIDPTESRQVKLSLSGTLVISGGSAGIGFKIAQETATAVDTITSRSFGRATLLS